MSIDLSKAFHPGPPGDIGDATRQTLCENRDFTLFSNKSKVSYNNQLRLEFLTQEIFPELTILEVRPTTATPLPVDSTGPVLTLCTTSTYLIS